MPNNSRQNFLGSLFSLNSKKTSSSIPAAPMSRPPSPIQAPYTSQSSATNPKYTPPPTPAKSAYISSLASTPTAPTAPKTQSTVQKSVVTQQQPQAMPSNQSNANDSYKEAFAAYIQSLQPTEEETAANTYLRGLIDTSKREEERALNMGETLGFARGEAERVNRNRALDIEAATGAYNALIGKRESINDAMKARLDFEKSMIPDRSPAYKEYRDAVDSGYTGTFTEYQTEDANRKRYANSGSSAAPKVIGSASSGYFQYDPETQSYAPLKLSYSGPSFDEYLQEAQQQLKMNIDPDSEMYAELKRQYEDNKKQSTTTKSSLESRIESLL